MPITRRNFLTALPVLGYLISWFKASSVVSEEVFTEDRTSVTSLLSKNSLEGWAPTDFFKPGKVDIQDGILKMSRGKPMTGVTSLKKDMPVSDFEIVFEARRIDGDDFFAALTFPVHSGFLTFVNGGWSGNITGLSSIDGSDASENETSCLYKFENEIWYQFRVRVEDQQIQCFINDKKVVDFDGTGRSLKTRVESRPSQPLGFACYDCESEIRNVLLKTL
jgi:hypothetical protein